MFREKVKLAAKKIRASTLIFLRISKKSVIRGMEESWIFQTSRVTFFHRPRRDLRAAGRSGKHRILVMFPLFPAYPSGIRLLPMATER